jgi:phage terminase large subunit
MSVATHDRWLERTDAEVRRRLHLAAQFSTPEAQAVALKVCASDPVAFINDWCWTFDPRNRRPLPKRLPMKLWPRQEELVRFVAALIEENTSGGIKKSRDQGVSWIAACVATWLLVFRPESVVTFGSRKEALVDGADDLDALIPKCRLLIEMLPPWMRPQIEDRFLFIRNPGNGSVIKGEAGDGMGRGGRSTVYFPDEWAAVPRADKVDAALSGNSDCVIYMSTSAGIGTNFYRKEKGGDLPFFHCYWTDDPRKDADWRAAKIRQVGPVTFAREYDGDDGAALDNVMIPAAWVLAAVDLDLPMDGPCQGGLDVADEGEDENSLAVRRGPVTTITMGWTGCLPNVSALRAAKICEDEGADRLAYDRVGVGAGAAGVLEVEGHRFAVDGVIAQATPTRTRYADDPDRQACDRFANLSAELWWNLRLLFENTWRYVHEGAEFSPDQLISIPHDDRLISQLSSRLFELTPTGKVAVESKKNMRRRGVRSPDRADALCLAFCPPLKLQIQMSADSGATPKVS